MSILPIPTNNNWLNTGEVSQTLPHYSQQPIVIAILYRDDKVYLSKRALNKSYPGMWQCPGGKCEPMEGILEAIARETKEETGLAIELARFDFYGILYIKGEGYSAAVWSVNLENTEIPDNVEPDKQSDWQLFSIAEMYQLGRDKELVPTLSKMLDVTIL